MMPDSLYRVSLKSIITNDEGKILVVKEAGRPFWDLPGGGMEHGETIRAALARELYEEVGLEGPFKYRVVSVDEPHLLQGREIHQVRLVFHVVPGVLPTEPGAESDEVAYVNPGDYKNSDHIQERQLYDYSQLLP